MSRLRPRPPRPCTIDNMASTANKPRLSVYNQRRSLFELAAPEIGTRPRKCLLHTGTARYVLVHPVGPQRSENLREKKQTRTQSSIPVHLYMRRRKRNTAEKNWDPLPYLNLHTNSVIDALHPPTPASRLPSQVSTTSRVLVKTRIVERPQRNVLTQRSTTPSSSSFVSRPGVTVGRMM